MPERAVAQLMTSGRIVQLSADHSVREASLLMARERVGAVLILHGDRLAGIFTERDVLNRVIAQDRRPEGTRLAEVMTADPVTVAPRTLAVEALRLMCDGGFRHLPVVEEGRVVGVVSLRDFLGAELAAVEREARFMALIAEGPLRRG